MSLSALELVNRYGHHTATTEGPDPTLPKHDIIRSNFLQISIVMNDLLPEGRCKEEVHRLLETASMWANKSVAEAAPLARLDGTN